MSAVDAEWQLFGVKKDAPIGEEILQGFAGKVCNRIGQTTLGELIAELRGCAALVTNDTGTMHLAAHLGVPVVAIFGSTEPALTGPLGRASRVIRHHVECSPCFLRDCPLDFRCMRGVKATEVVRALREVVGLGAEA
jgi:ADP-heptose:LPS heptosyltransferase